VADHAGHDTIRQENCDCDTKNAFFVRALAAFGGFVAENDSWKVWPAIWGTSTHQGGEVRRLNEMLSYHAGSPAYYERKKKHFCK
jgi:hypothetical protein